MSFDGLTIEALRKRSGKKWNAYSSDVLPAWVADMDFPVAPVIQESLRRLVEYSDVGYPLDDHAGRLSEILAGRCQNRFQWQPDPARIEVVIDVIQGLNMGVQMYSQSGEGVLMFTPIYPPFLEAVTSQSRRPDCHELTPGQHLFEIDWDRLQRDIRNDTRLLLLCNPHNPTGRVFTREELNRLAELVLKHDLMVVSDEVHCDLVFDDSAHIPFASLSPEIDARTVTLMSATKAFNIGGLRCALMIFGTNELHRSYLNGPRHTRGALNSLGLHGTEVAWTQADPWLTELMKYLQANRDFVQGYLGKHLPKIEHFPPEATFLAWLNCHRLGLGEGLWQTIHDKGKLALSDGRAFGPGGEHCVRLNFATSRSILREALQRLSDALR